MTCTAWEKPGEIFHLFFPIYSLTFLFLLLSALFLLLVWLFICPHFTFPASGQTQQLLRNCSRSDSCVHKYCTVGIAPAPLQLTSYRKWFFLSVLWLPPLLIFWSPACGRLATKRSVCDLLRTGCGFGAWTAVQSRISVFRFAGIMTLIWSLHIIFPRCLALETCKILMVMPRLQTLILADCCVRSAGLEFSCESIPLCSSNTLSIVKWCFYVLMPPTNHVVSTLKVSPAC